MTPNRINHPAARISIERISPNSYIVQRVGFAARFSVARLSDGTWEAREMKLDGTCQSFGRIRPSFRTAVLSVTRTGVDRDLCRVQNWGACPTYRVNVHGEWFTVIMVSADREPWIYADYPSCMTDPTPIMSASARMALLKVQELLDGESGDV